MHAIVNTLARHLPRGGDGSVSPVKIDFKPLMDVLTGSFTPESILTILATVVAAGVGFTFMWFGVRKLSRIFFGALQNGKIRL